MKKDGVNQNEEIQETLMMKWAKETEKKSKLIKDISSVTNFKYAALCKKIFPLESLLTFNWFNGFSERSTMAVVRKMRLTARSFGCSVFVRIANLKFA